jgi:hypothetical protein
MTEPGYLRYYDPRYGDTYEIYLNRDGTFLSAARSVEAIGRSPIYYDKLVEIPPFHRNAIETLIEEHLKNGG